MATKKIGLVVSQNRHRAIVDGVSEPRAIMFIELLQLNKGGRTMDEPKPQIVSPPLIEARAEVFAPKILTEVGWSGESLTFAAVVYGIVATVTGVLAAKALGWAWTVVYAVGIVVVGVLIFVVFHRRVILLTDKYLKWVRRPR
jgi:hypothetical protein